MKLYTEEQMRRCYAGIFQNVGTCIKQSDLPKEDEYINLLTPIEIPSDDKLEEISKHEILYNDSKRGWWLEGVSYILNVIKTQYEKDN